MGPDAVEASNAAQSGVESVGAVTEHVVGMAGNWSNGDIGNGLGKESENRNLFYKATNLFDSYLKNNAFQDKSITDNIGRGEIINFLTDGFLTSDNSKPTSLSMGAIEHNLKIAFAGIQLIYQNNIDLQGGVSEKFDALSKEYKSRGGKLNFDAAYDLKRPK